MPFKPDAQQLTAIESDSSRLLIIAGAGSGKTATVVARITRLVKSGVDPQTIVAITFTNKAAEELKGRFERDLLDNFSPGSLGFVGTIHAFVFKLIQHHRHHLGFRAHVTVMDEASASGLLADVIATHRYAGSKTQINALIAQGIPTLPPIPSKAQLVCKDYYDSMCRNNVIDVDSILTFGLELFSRMPELSILINGKPVQHLFVDEFQDCSDLDVAVFDRLPIANRCYVGDGDQSIYSFRGGNVKHILALASDPKWHVAKLESNYRSRSEICYAAQTLIKHNLHRIDKDIASVRGGAGHVTVHPAFASPGEERSMLLDSIREMINTYKVIPEEIAVLIRYNYLIAEYASFLELGGIKVAKFARLDLPNDWERCACLLSVLADPGNNYLAHAFLCLFRSRREANEIQLKALEAFTPINSILGFKRDGDRYYASEMFARHGISAESCEIFRAIASEVFMNLGQEPTLNEILIGLRDYAVQEAKAAGEGILVSTIHGAKGLEFKVVFLPCFEQAIIPGRDSDFEEARRLAYVAMTRAKDALIISHCQTRPGAFRTSLEAASPSQFLSEIR